MSLVGKLLVVCAFAAANLVAAGVLAVLGPQVLALEDGLVKAALVTAVGTLAVVCALLFLRGCMRARTHPLQYPPGRRGG